MVLMHADVLAVLDERAALDVPPPGVGGAMARLKSEIDEAAAAAGRQSWATANVARCKPVGDVLGMHERLRRHQSELERQAAARLKSQSSLAEFIAMRRPPPSPMTVPVDDRKESTNV